MTILITNNQRLAGFPISFELFFVRRATKMSSTETDYRGIVVTNN